MRSSLSAAATRGARQTTNSAIRAITLALDGRLTAEIPRVRHYSVRGPAKPGEVRANRGFLESGDAGLGRESGARYELLEATGQAAHDLDLRPHRAVPALRSQPRPHCGDELVIESMAAVVGSDVPDQRPPEQPQIADQVEHLVPDELILVAEAVVQHRALAHHHGVVEGAAASQAVFPHHRHVSQEAIGTCGGELLDERGLAYLERGDLEPDHRVRIVEGVGNAERVRRRDLEPALVVSDAQRLANSEGTPRYGQGDGARLVQEIDEGLGAAIEGRHFLG